MKALVAIAAAAVLWIMPGCSPDAGPSASAATGCEAGTDAGSSPAGLSQVRLCIDTGTEILPFTAELASTPEEQARGLMFRTELADDAAMLFPFPRERVASFWMKNTVIPLDLLFVRRDGTIESIAADAVPYDEAPLASGEPVIAVLELRGGLAAARGIEAGDTVRWAANDS